MYQKTIIEENICEIVDAQSDKTMYIILPFELKKEEKEWVMANADRMRTNVVVMSGMAWNDDMTPWPAEKVQKKGLDFGGKAKDYLEKMERQILPEIEKLLSKPQQKKAGLAGLSLSGLFALWASMQSGRFDKIGCISGSFWYDDFDKWLESNIDKASKLKKAYITLGEKEAKRCNSRFGKIGEGTEMVVEKLKSQGVDTRFDWSKGTHFEPVLPRMKIMLEWLSE